MHITWQVCVEHIVSLNDADYLSPLYSSLFIFILLLYSPFFSSLIPSSHSLPLKREGSAREHGCSRPTVAQDHGAALRWGLRRQALNPWPYRDRDTHPSYPTQHRGTHTQWELCNPITHPATWTFLQGSIDDDEKDRITAFKFDDRFNASNLSSHWYFTLLIQ